MALIKTAEEVGAALLARGLTMAAAESCTGGWVAQAVTSVPGSSQWFERGFVTYSNIAKREMLGVASSTLKTYGAVSEAVVKAMAEGALQHSHANVAVAISGIAGPGGGSADKPVGTVWLAWQREGDDEAVIRQVRFLGGRQQVREQATLLALQGLLALVAPESIRAGEY